MTLVLTAITHAYVVQVSDRLTTRWTPDRRRLLGVHDPFANKSVTYLGYDGIMTIAFAGAAYVGREPTDDWIARVLRGSPHERLDDGRLMTFGSGRGNCLMLNQACHRLQSAISAEPSLALGIELVIGGWRVRRHRLAQFVLAICRAGGSTTRTGHMRFRTDRLGMAFVSAGVTFDLSKFHRRIEQHPRLGQFAVDVSVMTDVLVGVLREVAATDRSVGRDAMIVEIPRFEPNPDAGHVVTTRFDPWVQPEGVVRTPGGERRVPVAYWPWILTPGGVTAPSFSVGDGMMLHSCGWQFLCRSAQHTGRTEGVLFAQCSVQRPPPP